MKNEGESQVSSVHHEEALRIDLTRKINSITHLKNSRNTLNSLHLGKPTPSISTKTILNSTNTFNKNNYLSSVLSQLHSEIHQSQNEVEKTLSKGKELRSKYQRCAILKKSMNSISTFDNDNKIEEKVIQNSGNIRSSEPIFKTGILQSNRSKSQYNKQEANEEVTCSDIHKSAVNQSQFAQFSRIANIISISKADNLKNSKRSMDLKVISMSNPEKEDMVAQVPSVKMRTSRIKNFKVSYHPDWFQKAGIPCIKLTPDIANSLEFQYQIISDELKVLLDNIQRYQMLYLGDSNILSIFKSIDSKYQKKLNSTIEETCGLMFELSYDILLDFSNYLEKFLSVKPPKLSNFKLRSVKNEEAEFVTNIAIFNDISSFLASCFDVYLILAKQVEDMILPFKIFLQVHQYLARCRLNVSNLMFSTQNYNKNLFHDQSLLMKYHQEMSKGTKMKEEEKEVAGGESNSNSCSVTVKNAERRTVSVSHDIADKIRDQYIFKLNEEAVRKRRLNAVLQIKREDEENSFEKKKKKVSKQFVKHFQIEDKKIDKILKYCPKKIKEQIISERLLKRFKEKNKENDSD